MKCGPGRVGSPWGMGTEYVGIGWDVSGVKVGHGWGANGVECCRECEASEYSESRA